MTIDARMSPSADALGHGSVLLSGPDARDFLQGQLSADLRALDRANVLLAACNSPQGRVQAVCRIVERADGILLVVARSMTDALIARLRKYVLRAKVTIAPGPAVQPVPLRNAGASSLAPRHDILDGASLVVLPGHSQALRVAPDSMIDAAAERTWHLETIRAGEPTIYPQTHEAFVAQMLNLDALGGISFEKGCYTGQEIIARAHFRGAVKRRMFRFRAAGSAPVPGTRILSGEQHAGDVVDAADVDNGCELLAVISLASLNERLTLADRADVVLERLELPYEIPD